MKIYLNAGHGGADSGAVGINGRMEKHETLKMSLAVKPLLESAGHVVVMERTTDIYKNVKDIVKEANAINPNLFVAIHLNSFLASAHGVECLTAPKCSAKSTKMAQEIAKRISSLGFTMRSPNTGGAKEQSVNTYVLKETTMPATTVEICFISNTQDMALYDAKFAQIARAIADGVCAVAGGAVRDNTYTYTAAKETPLLQVIRVLQPGETVELESYFTGDTLARVQGGQVIFSNFKK